MRTFPRSLVAAAAVGLVAAVASGLCLQPLQQAKFVDDDVPTPEEFFGGSVALDADTAVVTAYGKYQQRGAAYVYVRDRLGVWTRQARLLADDGADGDSFGDSVALEGDTAVVGAAAGDSTPGAAYAYVRADEVWTQEQKFVAEDAANGDAFGLAVALSGDTAVVGAFRKAADRGAAYVFTRTAGVWTQQQKLTAPDSAEADFFGVSTAVDGDTAVVGAFGKEIAQGAAYVYVRDGAGVWTMQQKLVAADAADGDSFGDSVAIAGDTIVVGADFENHAVPEDAYQGAAYVFTRSGSTWTQQQKLVAPDPEADDYFGVSVSLEGDAVLVGAYGKDFSRGAAYVFTRSGGVWTLQSSLSADDAVDGDNFGVDVAFDAGSAVIGAFSANDNDGAAYAFIGLLPPPAVPYVLPTKVRAKSHWLRPELSVLTASGAIDTGPGAPDFSGPATFDAGPFHLDVPAFTSKANGKVLTYSAGGVTLTIKPAANGSSRALFTLKAVGDFGMGLDPDGSIAFKFVNALYDARANVKLKGGALARPQAVVAPGLSVVAASATLKGPGKDALTLTAGFATTGVAPEAPENLTLCFGNSFSTEIPASAFRMRGAMAQLAAKTGGITKATVDYAKGTITIAGRGLDLGAFGAGGNGVVLSIALGDVDRAAQVRMSRARSKLAY
jgi:hypothetical protein